MSGAQIVFGIARRVPPPNTSKQISNTKIVSGSAKQAPHTTTESIIFHESNPATTFLQCDITSARSLFRTVSCSGVPRFEARFLLARLVEVEIVSPYCGILINTGVGNPTAPFARPLGTGEFQGEWEGA